MGAELEVRLTGLSAPGPLPDLAQPFADLESWWKACRSPELLLWLAARLCATGQQRRAVVSCLAELNRRAQHGTRRLDPRVSQASAAAEAWARDEARLGELVAAERGALAAAAAATVQAAEINARARALFRRAPRARAASFSNSRALGALADWREADRGRRRPGSGGSGPRGDGSGPRGSGRRTATGRRTAIRPRAHTGRRTHTAPPRRGERSRPGRHPAGRLGGQRRRVGRLRGQRPHPRAARQARRPHHPERRPAGQAPPARPPYRLTSGSATASLGVRPAP